MAQREGLVGLDERGGGYFTRLEEGVCGRGGWFFYNPGADYFVKYEKPEECFEIL